MSETENHAQVVREAPGVAPGERDPSEDRLLQHEYDGIQEFDNPMPAWWKLLFWGSFLFACGYVFHYHLSPNGGSVADEYALEVREASEAESKRALAEAVTEDSLGKLTRNEGMVLAGRALYEQKCVQCHDARGQGKIGPNLTDAHWIHGQGKLMDIYKVVHDGVPAKGMIAWGRTLKPVELRQVVTYVGTMRNTFVAGKAPEGVQAGRN